MLAKSKDDAKNHRAYARKIIKEITNERSFVTTERIRFGPRYFVAKGNYQKYTSLFKIALYPKSYDHLTNEKFSREILFLNIIQNSKFKNLKKSIPHIYDSSIKTRAWYFREYLTGKVQNINGGNIRFKDSFFTTAHLNWFINAFSELQNITLKDLPLQFKKLLYPHQTLEYLWRFISPDYKTLEKFIGIPGSTKDIHNIFLKNSKIYKNAPKVLAHQEVYSPHIININGQLKMIDWENIGWATPTNDIVAMWMRAHNHPNWQKKLKKSFQNKYKKYKQFDQLWDITVLVQSVYNVISYHHYFDKKDFEALAIFSGKMVKQILKKSQNK
ncbi:MAG: hypothetical protein ACNFW9_05255 [Candidatus Kerfeldbacteria bacterium]